MKSFHEAQSFSLGKYDSEVVAAINDIDRENIIRRMWNKDYTVWKNDPAEISDRLGWLTVAGLMQSYVSELVSFAQEIREARFRDVVLLGMGGSSLGAEVMRQVFSPAPGYPSLRVLDSTLPAAVKAIADDILPEQTLFIVSSKSGTTTEPDLLYRYFRSLVEKVKGKDAGSNFIAITDAGTPLVTMAQQESFRRAFLNPPDVGGRYSVLSYFGLVPAALIGIDIKTLLDRAVKMQELCSSGIPVADNPGCRLGTVMGTLANKGRDKLTLVTSPALKSLGLWLEQLIAESTGKEGMGIIPVAGEPLVSPAHYGHDRYFICLHLQNDNNEFTDRFISDLQSAGQPVIIIEMEDRYSLGAEFFRWEFATALAGSMLGIQPFNQPDVKSSKDVTEKLLSEYKQNQKRVAMSSSGTVDELLVNASPGKYLAIMAYLRQTPETDKAMETFRRKIIERYNIATTLGYGPRFLHSTGQLHKGGPDTGLFLQITANHDIDVPIPGEPYSFGVVVDAQAQGDFQALNDRNRKVIALHLPEDDPSLLENLADQI